MIKYAKTFAQEFKLLWRSDVKFRTDMKVYLTINAIAWAVILISVFV